MCSLSLSPSLIFFFLLYTSKHQITSEREREREESRRLVKTKMKIHFLFLSFISFSLSLCHSTSKLARHWIAFLNFTCVFSSLLLAFPFCLFHIIINASHFHSPSFHLHPMSKGYSYPERGRDTHPHPHIESHGYTVASNRHPRAGHSLMTFTTSDADALASSTFIGKSFFSLKAKVHSSH